MVKNNKTIEEIIEELRLNKDNYNERELSHSTKHSEFIKKLTNKKTGVQYYTKKYSSDNHENSKNRLAIREYLGYKIYKMFSMYTNTLSVSKRMIVSLEKDEDHFNGYEYMLTSRADFGNSGATFRYFTKKYDQTTSDIENLDDEGIRDRDNEIMRSIRFVNLPFLACTGHIDLHSNNIIKKKGLPTYYLIDFEHAITTNVSVVFMLNASEYNIRSQKTYALKTFLRNYDTIKSIIDSNKIDKVTKDTHNDFINLLHKEKSKEFLDNENYNFLLDQLELQIETLRDILKNNIEAAMSELKTIKNTVKKSLQERDKA